MEDIRLKGHFHIVYILKIIRYGLILCLVPMIQALLNFDLESLYRALRQDAVILIAMAALGAVLWRRVGFALTDKALVLDMGILVRRRASFARRDIAVLEQDRPLWLRLAGGSRVTVYMARGRGRNRATFYLPRRQAAALAETLLPVNSEAVLFAPTRAERVRLTMLSANIAATAALVLVSLRQTRRILGAGLEQKLNDLALGQLAQVEKLLELVLPAGVAWLVTLVFALWGGGAVRLALVHLRVQGVPQRRGHPGQGRPREPQRAAHRRARHQRLRRAADPRGAAAGPPGGVSERRQLPGRRHPGAGV